uniref:Uncharacterized protein n=1 Tax=Setaria italica TaxID=4555 RepID=K3Z209_SETIT
MRVSPTGRLPSLPHSQAKATLDSPSPMRSMDERDLETSSAQQEIWLLDMTKILRTKLNAQVQVDACRRYQIFLFDIQ